MFHAEGIGEFLIHLLILDRCIFSQLVAQEPRIDVIFAVKIHAYLDDLFLKWFRLQIVATNIQYVYSNMTGLQ